MHKTLQNQLLSKCAAYFAVSLYTNTVRIPLSLALFCFKISMNVMALMIVHLTLSAEMLSVRTGVIVMQDIKEMELSVVSKFIV